ncbi:hypothetical protein D3C76_636560 [compost metagenome]
MQLPAPGQRPIRRRRVGKAGAVRIGRPITPLVAAKGHPPFALAGLIRRLAERRRQVDGNALQTGADLQLAVVAGQQQVQLIGNPPAERQRLGHRAPVEQGLHWRLASQQHPGAWIATTAFGTNAAAHPRTQHLGADVLRAETAVGVVAEITLELGHLQFRPGNLEARAIAGEVHDHPGVLRLLLGQRNIQLQPPLQGTLALPTGKGLLRPDRRVLEDLQSVADAAVEIAIDMQMGGFPRLRVRNIDHHIADPALQDAAAGGFDMHPAVFHQHFAVGLAQFGPARLVVQFAAVHLEIQTHGVRFRRRPMVQRTLPLEIALLDTPGLDRRVQPGGEVLAHRRQPGRQVLFGEARIAIPQADAQIHVILLLRIAHQADQHVAGQAAFLALDAHQRAAEGEGLLVQAPEESGMGLAVAPRLREQMGQVQDEILRTGVELAAAQVAAEGAADVLHRRHFMEGADAGALQVHRIADPLGTGALRPVVEIDVVQHPARAQAGQPGHHHLRQWRQSGDGGGQRRQVDAVGAQLPALFALELVLQLKLRLAPAGVAEIGREIRHPQAQVVALALQEQAHAQVAQDHRRTVVIGRSQARSMQARGSRRRYAALDSQPKLAARPEFRELPLAGQTRRQPLCPVALRQAGVTLERTAFPVVTIQAGIDAQRQRLAIRQMEATFQALAPADAVAQGQADLTERHRFGMLRLDNDLAVQQREAARQQQQVQQLAWVAAFAPGGQALDLPATVLAFAQSQLQPFQLQRIDLRLARQQAFQHIRHHSHLLQAQQVVALANLDIARHHHRAEAAPVPFERTDLHRQAEPRGRPRRQFLAVFADQRRQLPSQADVKREQYQAEGAKRQEQSQGAGNQVAKAFHSARRSREGPRHIAPGNTSARPGT